MTLFLVFALAPSSKLVNTVASALRPAGTHKEGDTVGAERQGHSEDGGVTEEETNRGKEEVEERVIQCNRLMDEICMTKVRYLEPA